MPVLRVFPLKGLVLDLLFELMKEPILGSHAEVADCEETEFLKYKLSAQFKLNASVAHEVLQREGRDLHDVADVETVDPFTLV